jgi:hypothetical protein
MVLPSPAKSPRPLGLGHKGGKDDETTGIKRRSLFVGPRWLRRDHRHQTDDRPAT